MKRIFLILLLIPGLTAWGTKYYCAPTTATPAGNDGNAGTIAAPFFTLEAAWAAVTAGDTIYMRGGTYEYTTRQDLSAKNGSDGSRINIYAYPSETPIITRHSTFDVSVQGQLILIDADYIHLKGLEITGFYQVEGNRAWCPIQCTTTSHSIFELLNVHHNGMGMIIEDESDDNLILNSDFHHNYDNYGRTPFDGSSYAYNDGDGLIVREMPTGYNNTIIGCRMWSNADDGLDLWGGDGYVTIDGCWAWMNGYREDGTTEGGDGNGFKLGETTTLDSTVFARTIQNCVAFDNRLYGIDQNGALCKHYVYNNTAFRNGSIGFWFSSGWGWAEHIIRNNIGYDNPTNASINSSATVDHNSWNGIDVADDDFVSIDTSGIRNARQASGSLPDILFLHLGEWSVLRGIGVSISGLTEDCDGNLWGAPPSLGAYEYGTVQGETTSETTLGTGTGNNLMVDKNGRIIIIQ